MSATRLSASPIIVDSHQHFWERERFEYASLPPEPSVLTHDYLPDDLAPLLKRSKVSKTVLVQADSTVDEARFLLDLADANTFIAGVVAWVDLASPDVGRSLDELSRRSKLVGIRHLIHEEPDDAWMSRDEIIAGLKEVASRDLAYDLLVRPQHLKYVPSLAERIPNLRLVVDHIAKPLIAQGVMESWADDIAAVATVPSIYCKISGMVTEANHSNWHVGHLKPYVEHVIEQFGHDRLMFGSDWPVCLLAANYDQVLNTAIEAMGTISNEDIVKVLGQNAIDFYRL